MTEEDHVSNLSAPLRLVWESLRDRLAEYSGTSFSARQAYISWNLGGTIVCRIHFLKNKGGLGLYIVRGDKRGHK